jgi:hypothetical protein
MLYIHHVACPAVPIVLALGLNGELRLFLWNSAIKIWETSALFDALMDYFHFQVSTILHGDNPDQQASVARRKVFNTLTHFAKSANSALLDDGNAESFSRGWRSCGAEPEVSVVWMSSNILPCQPNSNLGSPKPFERCIRP